MNKKRQLALFLLIGLLLVSFRVSSQKEEEATDDLGNVSDTFQEHFFEALKQKGIENYGRAVDALQKCLTINDKLPFIYFELGKNYNKLKNFGAAEDNLKKAISMQPDNVWSP